MWEKLKFTRIFFYMAMFSIYFNENSPAVFCRTSFDFDYWSDAVVHAGNQVVTIASAFYWYLRAYHLAYILCTTECAYTILGSSVDVSNTLHHSSLFLEASCYKFGHGYQDDLTWWLFYNLTCRRFAKRLTRMSAKICFFLVFFLREMNCCSKT